MNDYILPMMRAIERIREAQGHVEENRLDLAEKAAVDARGQVSDAIMALIDEQSDRRMNQR